MTKFNAVERLKNVLRSYEMERTDNFDKDISGPVDFKPNPDDVRKLITKYENLRNTLHEGLVFMIDNGKIEIGTPQSNKLVLANNDKGLE